MKKTLREFCDESRQSQLIEQWDVQRNLPLTPDLVTYGSKKKVWWRCERGHTWQASVCTRTGVGTRCPFCAGKIPITGENDLQSQYPDLVRQWHPTRNEITPRQVLPGSHKAVWWLCERGHIWKASVKSRVAGSGCPVCTNRTVVPKENDLATEFPEIAAQWHHTKMEPVHHMMSLLEVDAKSGGFATKDTSGRLRSMRGRWVEMVARYVQDAKSYPEKMIWPANSQRSQRNGILRRTELSHHSRLRHMQIEKSGGSVN